jgi:hypothetical protein
VVLAFLPFQVRTSMTVAARVKKLWEVITKLHMTDRGLWTIEVRGILGMRGRRIRKGELG